MLGPFRAFLLVAPLVLAPVLFATATPSFAHEHNDDDEDVSNSNLRELGEDTSTGSREGFGFLLRRGDSTIAVRCDPNDSMKAFVEATSTLLERARSNMPSAPSAAAPK